MNTIIRALTLVSLLVLLAVPSQAQTIMNNTTLAAAITSTTTDTIQLTTISFTPAIAAGDLIFVVGGNELMRVLVAPTVASNVRVQRGQGGTRPTTHRNAARVYTTNLATHPTAFTTRDPAYNSVCQREDQDILPIVNIATGVVWTCGHLGNAVDTDLDWRATSSILAFTYNSVPVGRFTQPAEDGWFAFLGRWLDRRG